MATPVHGDVIVGRAGRFVTPPGNNCLPVRVLGKLFRGKFLGGVKEAYHAGLLRLESSVSMLADRRTFSGRSNLAMTTTGSCMPSLPSAEPSTCFGTWD